jgi:hypothetical protein
MVLNVKMEIKENHRGGVRHGCNCFGFVPSGRQTSISAVLNLQTVAGIRDVAMKFSE